MAKRDIVKKDTIQTQLFKGRRYKKQIDLNAVSQHFIKIRMNLQFNITSAHIVTNKYKIRLMNHSFSILIILFSKDIGLFIGLNLLIT